MSVFDTRGTRPKAGSTTLVAKRVFPEGWIVKIPGNTFSSYGKTKDAIRRIVERDLKTTPHIIWDIGHREVD